MQGQTTYGGVSAALCLAGARHLLGDEALPLRSALIDFIGAAGGHVRTEASLMRRGRSSSVVRSDLLGAEGVATSGTFTFASDRRTNLAERSFVPPPPELPPPSECPSMREACGVEFPTFF